MESIRPDQERHVDGHRQQASLGIPVFDCQLGSWHVAVARSPSTVEALRRGYDRLAERWPCKLKRLGFVEAYRRLAGKLQSLCPDLFTDGMRVLECGAGTGAMSLALGTSSRAQLQHHLLDLSPRMLEMAGASFHRMGIEATLRLADIRNIPYGGASFDFVMAAHVVEHLPDPVTALREMNRVLKPGGRMLLLVTRRSWLGALVQLRWPVHCVTRHEVRDWLWRGGLSRIHWLPLEGPWWCGRMSIACIGVKEPLKKSTGPRRGFAG